jgi:hypothetical protein
MTPEEPSETRVVAKRFQVGVAADLPEVGVTKAKGTLKSGKSLVGHSQQGITAREVVPGDRPLGVKPDELEVRLEGAVIEPLGGKIFGVNFEHVGVERIANEDTAEEVELEIELTLLAEPSGRDFRRRPFGEGVVGTLRHGHG